MIRNLNLLESVVTDGLAILAAWLMFAALLIALATVILTGGPKS